MKPEVSIPVALATGAVVVGIYSTMTPSDADARTVQPGSVGANMLAGTERTALLASVAACAGISLIAKDPTPFYLGGLLAVGLSWSQRFSTNIDPSTGRIAGKTAGTGQLMPSRTIVTSEG